MDNVEKNSYDHRLAKLEREISSLKESVNSLVENKTPVQSKPEEQAVPPAKESLQQAETSVSAPMPAVAQTQEPPRPTLPPRVVAPPKESSISIPEHMRSGEYWLNKVGIGLVLFAVLFFFKYSIDQGWLTPEVRIGMGLTLGIALNVIAFRIYGRRRHFSLVMFGGGIATFYITGFAAFQLFQLVPHLTAMGFMVLVTVFAIGVSVKQGEQVLSLIGAIGGLATPFLLYTGQGNIPGLITYTCVLIGGIAAIYFFKSWRALLWFTVFSGWSIMILACADVIDRNLTNYGTDHWATQYGLVFCWLAFGVVPLIREIFAQISPERFKYIKFDYLKKLLSEEFERVVEKHAFPLVISSPLIALSLSMFVWEKYTTQEFWGWIAMGIAVIYGAAAYGISKWDELKSLAYIHMMIGLLLVTISFSLLLDGNSLLFTLSAEALILFLIGRKVSDKGLAASSNVLFFIVGFWLFIRIAEVGRDGTALFNLQAMTDLWTIGTALTVAYLASSRVVKRIYLIAAFACLGGLFAREFDGNLLFAILTGLALTLHYIAWKFNDRISINTANLFVGIIGVWLVDRLLLPRIVAFPIDLQRTPILNLTTLADASYLATLVIVSRILATVDEKRIYLLGLHLTILAVFLRDFQGLENGQGYVSIAWGAYAAILLIAGLRLDNLVLRKVSIITLMLVVGKLFLVDLANLETIWRILLFLGVGGAFLFLSYYFKTMWKAKEEQ